MSENQVHEEYKKLSKEMAKINTQRGGGANALKGFYAELANSSEDNVKRIDNGVTARQRVINNNGPADAVIQYSDGSYGRQIQDKCGYDSSAYKKFIEDGKYDGMILRINNDNPLFSDQEQLETLTNLAKKHNIKIEKSQVSAAEMQKLAEAANVEGQIRSKVGLEQTAPVTSSLYAGSKELAYTAGKAENQLQDIRAKAVAQTEVAQNIIQNAGSEFITGSTQALADSVIPLTSEAVRRLCNVASGKESLDEAAKGLGKTALDIAVVGGGKRVAADIVLGTIKNSQNAALQSIISSSTVNQIVAVGVIVKDSAVKYLNGEISGEEFIEEIGDKGVSMVAGMIAGQVGQELGAMVGTAIGTVILPVIGTAAGYAAGKIIGQVLGVILTTAACTAVFSIRNSLKHMDDYKKKESMIKRIEQDALKEMEYQRNALKELIREEFDYWDKEIEEGFDQILCNASEGVWNAEGVAEGLDRILKIFGKEVRFHSINEYEEQLDSTLQLSF